MTTLSLGKAEANACMAGKKSELLAKSIEKFIAAARLERNI
jgi:hypothetical protein